LNDSSLCGYLHINGLTEEYPELTTFFEAEIVGPDYSFVTRKWEADVKTDKEHWVKGFALYMATPLQRSSLQGHLKLEY